MDETAGPTVEDYCNNICGVGPSGYPLTAVNTPTFNQSGVNASRGTSILFDAASQEYLEGAANDTGTGPADYSSTFTSGCWAKADTGSTRNLITTSHKAHGTPTSLRIWVLVVSAGQKIAQAWFNKEVPDGNTVVQLTTGTTTITTNTWHFYVFTWETGTETTTVYLDGLPEATTVGFSAAQIPNSVEVITIGTVTSAASPNYLQGYAQDCFIIRSKLSPGQIIQLYDSTTDDWPYNVKMQPLPKYMEPEYFARMASNGYTNGLWTSRVARPRIVGPFVPFSAIKPVEIHR
jgi:hypothetical protein